MHPTLFGFIPSYIALAVVGFIAAFGVGVVRRKQYAYKMRELAAMLCACIVGLMIGAKLLFAITEIPAVINSNFSWEVIEKRIINGGLVFYGGVIGMLAGVYIATKYLKLDTGRMLSFVTPSITVFHAFGRIGCFLEGCCYGLEADHGIAFPQYFTDGSVKYITRIPIQLYEAAVLVIISAVLILLEQNALKRGKFLKLLPLYIAMYAPARFVLEMFRGDVLRGVTDVKLDYHTSDGQLLLNFTLSTSQIISLILLLCLALYGFSVYVIRKNEKKKATANELTDDIAEKSNAENNKESDSEENGADL